MFSLNHKKRPRVVGEGTKGRNKGNSFGTSIWLPFPIPRPRSPVFLRRDLLVEFHHRRAIKEGGHIHKVHSITQEMKDGLSVNELRATYATRIVASFPACRGSTCC